MRSAICPAHPHEPTEDWNFNSLPYWKAEEPASWYPQQPEALFFRLPSL